MKIHYFQRYHSKENVATANTMLLLSRLYSYSSDKFFEFLKSEFFDDTFSPEIVFTLQEKNADSVPDAVITQEGFKIVVETKRTDSFDENQLLNHLQSFKDEKYKVILTLAPWPMKENEKTAFERKLNAYNEKHDIRIIHVNTTFEALANAIGDVLDDRDFEMQHILDDYMDYCYSDRLIPDSDRWKYMRVQLAGKTFDFNVSSNVYYQNAERKFRAYDTLGLYKQKSVRAIGKITAIITAIEIENEINFEPEYGTLTEDIKETIRRAMKDGDSYGYNLWTVRHRYFFVEKFYETNFKKVSPRAPMGGRVLDLTQVLETANLPETEKLAEILKNKSWI